MLCLSPGYPDAVNEALIIESHRRTGNPVDDVQPVASGDEILACREAIVSVHVDEAVRDYLIAFSAATRSDQRVSIGASPRASIALYRAAQSLAAIRGRLYVIPEDVKELLLPVFRKRIMVKPEYLMRGYRSETIITEIASSVPVPAFRER
jgi:MoxR-like ATPase